MQSKQKAKNEVMNIGKVAKLSGVGVETIRFYERQGVLPESKRKLSGYRQFDMQTVTRIRYIKDLQGLGFSLAEAGNLASGRGIPKAMARIAEQIKELKGLQAGLLKRSRSARRN